MNRIEKKFKELKRKNKKALVAFITAGYPSLSATEKLIIRLEQAGVDIIELGIPFSDPMADGPIIQESSQEALNKGVNVVNILQTVRRARKQVRLPLCLMTYYNPVFRYGQDRFVRDSVASGVDGLIVPDLPPDEAAGLIKKARKTGLDTIFFVSPTTSRERMKFIAKNTTGFIYYVSTTGVTGPRSNIPGDLLVNLRAIKNITSKPVCVGFGVSNRDQALKISRIADGVIVGSAIVKKIKECSKHPAFINKVAAFVSSLKI
ncbi:MAG: tryptophan synthase subunit alpha [Candidatus Omnitrophota bacterium]|jgi:tryptophan synthase alpha chain|nr:MAG: tryptophan synthase subunit alpha [Candidatus Omnitrophota bacterium]